MSIIDRMKRFKSLIRGQISYYFPDRHSGLAAEIDFWRYWLESKALGDTANYEYRLQPDAPIRGFYAELIDQLDSEVIEILDVGSGPLTTIGRTYPGKTIHLTAVDPLADAYNELLTEKGLVAPVKPLPIMGEELTTRFSPGSFDLVMAVNSLDHTENPVKVIQEMIQVCKPGGMVGLVHREKEGLNQNYRDLHQWNFYLSGEHLTVSGRRYRKIINEVVHPFEFNTRVNNGFIYSWGKKPLT
jgi:SAM-dependent methyltransferase